MKLPYYTEIRHVEGMYEYPRPNGFVYEHREVAAVSIGRRLRHGEHVHHKNEDRLDNSPSNLMVFSTNADHTRHHRGAAAIPNGDGTYRTDSKKWKCQCGNTTSTGSTRCVACYRKSAASGIPDREVLEALVWEIPSTQIAQQYGVSDVAVAKWCKKYDIKKPPRGYWRKQATLVK